MYIRKCVIGLIFLPFIFNTQASDVELNNFLQWAKQNAHPIKSLSPGTGFDDLQVLKEIVGDARIVGIGESVHATHEFSKLQHRIVEFLVEEMGFTAVAVESGLAESKLINDFVLGGEAPPDLWELGLAKYYSHWQEMRDLVTWIRTYNKDPSHKRKLHFYGIDVPGYYRTWVPAFEIVATYLDNVDPTYAKEAREKITPLLEAFAAKDQILSYEVYGRSPIEQRQEYNRCLDDLINRFKLYRLTYLEKSSADEFAWAFQATKNLKQAEVFYKDIVARYHSPKLRKEPVNVRDLAMAENLRWVINQEGAEGRIAVINHNIHIQTLPTTRKRATAHPTAAMYLQSLINGTGYVAIGTAYNKGKRWDSYVGPGTSEIEPSKENSVDGLLARVGLPTFILSFKNAKAGSPISQFLEQDIETRVDVRYSITKLKSWDALIFIDEISPAHRPRMP
jgi:erythromycin esterase